MAESDTRGNGQEPQLCPTSQALTASRSQASPSRSNARRTDLEIAGVILSLLLAAGAAWKVDGEVALSFERTSDHSRARVRSIPRESADGPYEFWNADHRLECDLRAALVCSTLGAGITVLSLSRVCRRHRVPGPGDAFLMASVPIMLLFMAGRVSELTGALLGSHTAPVYGLLADLHWPLAYTALVTWVIVLLGRRRSILLRPWNLAGIVLGCFWLARSALDLIFPVFWRV